MSPPTTILFWFDPEETRPPESRMVLTMVRDPQDMALYFNVDCYEAQRGWMTNHDVLAWAYLPQPDDTLPPRYTARDMELLAKAGALITELHGK